MGGSHPGASGQVAEGTYSNPASGSVYIEWPAVEPKVVVLGPAMTDDCSPLELDATPSAAVPRPSFAWRCNFKSTAISMYFNIIDSRTLTQVRDFFAVRTSCKTCSAPFSLPMAESSFARLRAFSGFCVRKG